MKTWIASVAVLWFVIMAELAWRSHLPHGCLLIPVACAVLCWSRSAAALLITGAALLVDWIARPTTLPLCAMLLPVIATVSLAPQSGFDRDHNSGRRRGIPGPLQVPLLTFAGVLLHIAGTLPLQLPESLDAVMQQLLPGLQSTCLIALPVSAVGSLLIRFADEFGLRRSFGMTP